MNAVVQFRIPKMAANAVELDGLRDRARAAGLNPFRVEISRTKGGLVRITCHRPIADRLADELAALIDSSVDHGTREACRRGLQDLTEEMARGESPPIGPSING